MTLRNEIEKITKQTLEELTGFPSIIGYGNKSLTPLLADRICEAIGKTVEGMPSVEAGVGNWAKGYYSGLIEQLKSDKAYWKEQVK